MPLLLLPTEWSCWWCDLRCLCLLAHHFWKETFSVPLIRTRVHTHADDSIHFNFIDFFLSRKSLDYISFGLVRKQIQIFVCRWSFEDNWISVRSDLHQPQIKWTGFSITSNCIRLNDAGQIHPLQHHLSFSVNIFITDNKKLPPISQMCIFPLVFLTLSAANWAMEFLISYFVWIFNFSFDINLVCVCLLKTVWCLCAILWIAGFFLSRYYEISMLFDVSVSVCARARQKCITNVETTALRMGEHSLAYAKKSVFINNNTNNITHQIDTIHPFTVDWLGM